MRRFIAVLALAFLLSLNASPAKGEFKMISKGKKVKFHYTLTVKGNVVDSSEGQEPLEYTHGEKMIIPGLERQLEGLKAGEEKSVIVAPEDAYGPVNPNAFLELPKSNLAPGQEPQQGMMLKLEVEPGKTLSGVIMEVKEDTVMINFNHPLAGQELNFQITIVEVQ